jgi:membrane protein YqaA with SNARE-associated domain
VSNSFSNKMKTEVGRGRWFKDKIIPPLVIIFVIAITVILFLYRERVSELGNYGYLGAFLVSMIGNATIILPTPSFLVLIALGASLNPLLVGLSGGVGGALGEMTCYLLGYGGHQVVQNRWFYDKAVQWVNKWGVLAFFVFASTPLPFDVVGMVAGLLRFPFWKFFLALLCGKIIKYVVLAYAGALGWEAVTTGVNPATTAAIAAIATLILLGLALLVEDWTWKRRRR